jgi:hypothetical protein
MGLATFLLGNVQRMERYVSPNTDVRETQWREFFYIQDTWRATPKLTINYGLRADIINPQAVNEPENGGWLDIQTGEIRVAGVGDTTCRQRRTRSTGPAAGNHFLINAKTVIFPGRGYDISVFGPPLAIPDQDLPANGRELNQQPERVQPRHGPSAGLPGCHQAPSPQTGFLRLLPDERTLPRRRSRDAAAPVELRTQWSSIMSNERFSRQPATEHQQPPSSAMDADQNQRRSAPRAVQTVDGLSGAYGWTQGIDYFSNTGESRYNAFQAKLTRRFRDGYSLLTHYTYQKHKNNDGDYFFNDSDLNYGPANFIRTHVCFGLRRACSGSARWGATRRASRKRCYGWRLRQRHDPERAAFRSTTVRWRRSTRGRPAWPDQRPEHGKRRRISFRSNTPIAWRAPSPPAAGTFGNLPRNELRGRVVERTPRLFGAARATRT